MGGAMPWWPDPGPGESHAHYLSKTTMQGDEICVMPDTGAHDDLCGSMWAYNQAKAANAEGLPVQQKQCSQPRSVHLPTKILSSTLDRGGNTGEVVVVMVVVSAVVVNMAATSHIDCVNSFPVDMVRMKLSRSLPMLLPILNPLDMLGLDAMPCVQLVF